MGFEADAGERGRMGVNSGVGEGEEKRGWRRENDYFQVGKDFRPATKRRVDWVMNRLGHLFSLDMSRPGSSLLCSTP
jgi:hypothetical protein